MKKTALIVAFALWAAGQAGLGTAHAQTSKCDQDNYFYHTRTATLHEDSNVAWVGQGHFCQMTVGNGSANAIWAMWFDSATVPVPAAGAATDISVGSGNGVYSSVSTVNFLTAGFKVGQEVSILGNATAANNGFFAVTAVAAASLTTSNSGSQTESAGSSVTITRMIGPQMEFPLAASSGTGVYSYAVPFYNGLVLACSSTEGYLTPTTGGTCQFSAKVVP